MDIEINAGVMQLRVTTVIDHVDGVGGSLPRSER